MGQEDASSDSHILLTRRRSTSRVSRNSRQSQLAMAAVTAGDLRTAHQRVALARLQARRPFNLAALTRDRPRVPSTRPSPPSAVASSTYRSTGGVPVVDVKHAGQGVWRSETPGGESRLHEGLGHGDRFVCSRLSRSGVSSHTTYREFCPSGASPQPPPTADRPSVPGGLCAEVVSEATPVHKQTSLNSPLAGRKFEPSSLTRRHSRTYERQVHRRRRVAGEMPISYDLRERAAHPKAPL